MNRLFFLVGAGRSRKELQIGGSAFECQKFGLGGAPTVRGKTAGFSAGSSDAMARNDDRDGIL